MFVIVATWYDNTNQPFLTEYFESNIHEETILDFYKQQKSVYKREVIASYPDTRVFSDGTRVILQLCQIKQKVDEQTIFQEGYIDVEARTDGQGVPRLTG